METQEKSLIVAPEFEFDQVREVIVKKDYKFFEKGDYNINFVPIRLDDKFDNKFSDVLCLLYFVDGVPNIKQFKYTTLAGTLGIGGEQNPLTKEQTGTDTDGVAVVLEGQYLKGLRYCVGGSRYPFTQYFKQITAYNYLRDNDKNGREI